MKLSLTLRRCSSSRVRLFVGFRFEVLERQVVELGLEPADPQTVGQRGVDLPGLAGDPFLLFGAEVFERAHVVQPVAQLDQDHADVVDHRQDHAPEVFGLRDVFAGELELGDLGHPGDDVGHVGAEVLLDALDRGQRVLDDVVEQPRGDAVSRSSSASR